MWLEEYPIDGLHSDRSHYIRNLGEGGTFEIPDGWSPLQAINETVSINPGNHITIAEDLQSNGWITKHVGSGRAEFGSQWDPRFVLPIRAAVITSQHQDRSLNSIRDAIFYSDHDDAFERVIYSESHDDVANGQSLVHQEVSPDDPTGWYAQRRSTMSTLMVFRAAGIPMLFQGQEFLEGE
jgi:1,4-alpha-glucan branching enzyme